MKMSWVIGLATLAVTASGFAATESELLDRLEKLEKRVIQLENQVKKQAAARRGPPPQTAAYKIDIGESPILGDASAPIDFVVFSDIQCPYCARTHFLLEEVVKDPELSKKVRVVYKHFPLSFHKAARPAAKATLAAREQGDEYFWLMLDKTYKNQRALTEENFKKWAGEIGLDVYRFEQDLKENDAAYEKLIGDDIRVGRTAAQVRGTPTFFVGGWKLQERSLQGVKNLIKEKKLAE